MLPSKGEAGARAGRDDERFNPLIPYLPMLAPRRLHRLAQSGPCAQCTAQEIDHNVAADAADRAPSAASAIGAASVSPYSSLPHASHVAG